MSDADERVARFIVKTYREEGFDEHLTECADLTATLEDMNTGPGACDTGCDRVQFTAAMACPHGIREQFEWGDWGDLPDMLAEMDREASAVPEEERQ